MDPAHSESDAMAELAPMLGADEASALLKTLSRWGIRAIAEPIGQRATRATPEDAKRVLVARDDLEAAMAILTGTTLGRDHDESRAGVIGSITGPGLDERSAPAPRRAATNDSTSARDTRLARQRRALLTVGIIGLGPLGVILLLIGSGRSDPTFTALGSACVVAAAVCILGAVFGLSGPRTPDDAP